MLSIRKKLEDRSYASISVFSAELASVFTSEIGVQPAGDTAELQMQISGRAPELSLEQREKRKLAKRIIKAIQPGLEDAVMKESELNRKPFEKELKDLDQIFEFSVQSRRNSVAGSAELGNAEGIDGMEQDKEEGDDGATTEPKPEEQPNGAEDLAMTDVDAAQPSGPVPESQSQEAPGASMETSGTIEEPEKETSEVLATTENTTGEVAPSSNGDASTQPPNGAHETQKAPPTPPLSFQEDQLHPLAQGGIQWYMEPFDPVGTTIHEERWTGRDVMRGMSEELSELDEDELQDLVDDELDDKPAGAVKKATRSTAKEEPEQEPELGNKNESADGAPARVHRTRRRIVQRYNFG